MAARERPSRLVLLGHPVDHSLSPIFQNAALAHIASRLRYEALDVAPGDLAQTMTALTAQRAAGNVTIPHKQSVATRARCTPLALRVGAVNTFWHEDGILCGENTDVAGVVASIAALCPQGVTHARCAVLGAGGAAAAVLVALERLGCRDIVLTSRTTERARSLITQVQVAARVANGASEAVQGADLVINATPIGLHDEAVPVPMSALAAHASILDLVYRAGETSWVRACRAAGHASSDGLRMLVEQGAHAFECWFDVPAPRQVMWDSLASAIGRGA